MAYSKDELVSRIYRKKEVGDKIYSSKRAVSDSEKTSINSILSNFLASVVAAN
jgi:hypothetical protein|tara:strand:+ start:1073 stop:1231 length:159 start_codon:yes stop_codon:yes gene_type:complete